MIVHYSVKKLFGIKHLFLKISLLFILIALVVRPDKLMDSCYKGLLLFAVNVLPALLPFFFFSKILTSLNFADDLGRLLGKPFIKLYGVPPCASYVFSMSVISGYPIGAKLISDLYKSGSITRNEAKTITAFCSTSGPMFILGSVGAAMLNNKSFAIVIYTAHCLSAFINGFLYRNKKNVPHVVASIPCAKKIDSVLSESIYSSVISVLTVGAYVGIFYMLADLFVSLGIISFIVKPFGFIAPNVLTSGIAEGLIEMTRGCYVLSKSALTEILVIPALTGIITVGGLSVTLQSMTFLKEIGIKTSFYIATKTTQTLIAVTLSFIFTLIFF